MDALSQLVPDPDLFLYFYVRKEAVLSSQIEGTQSSLSDLLLFETDAAPGVPLDDVQEVSREETAGQAVALAGQIRDLFARDRQRIAKLGRVAGSALRVHELLQHHPLLSVPKAVKLMDLTPPTVRSSLTALAEVGIVREVSGRRRDRVYGYRRYLDLIASDTQA